MSSKLFKTASFNVIVCLFFCYGSVALPLAITYIQAKTNLRIYTSIWLDWRRLDSLYRFSNILKFSYRFKKKVFICRRFFEFSWGLLQWSVGLVCVRDSSENPFMKHSGIEDCNVQPDLFRARPNDLSNTHCILVVRILLFHFIGSKYFFDVGFKLTYLCQPNNREKYVTMK